MKYFISFERKDGFVEFNNKKELIDYILNSYSQDQLEMFVTCPAKYYETRVVDKYGNCSYKFLKESL